MYLVPKNNFFKIFFINFETKSFRNPNKKLKKSVYKLESVNKLESNDCKNYSRAKCYRLDLLSDTSHFLLN